MPSIFPVHLWWNLGSMVWEKWDWEKTKKAQSFQVGYVGEWRWWYNYENWNMKLVRVTRYCVQVGMLSLQGWWEAQGKMTHNLSVLEIHDLYACRWFITGLLTTWVERRMREDRKRKRSDARTLKNHPHI